MDDKLKDYLVSKLTEEEKKFLTDWLAHDKKLPYDDKRYCTAGVTIIVRSGVTNSPNPEEIFEDSPKTPDQHH